MKEISIYEPHNLNRHSCLLWTSLFNKWYQLIGGEVLSHTYCVSWCIGVYCSVRFIDVMNWRACNLMRIYSLSVHWRTVYFLQNMRSVDEVVYARETGLLLLHHRLVFFYMFKFWCCLINLFRKIYLFGIHLFYILSYLFSFTWITFCCEYLYMSLVFKIFRLIFPFTHLLFCYWK